MAVTAAGVQTFLQNVVSLTSFPVFIAYLIMIMLSPAWQRLTSPLQLRPILVVHNFTCSVLSVYAMLGLMYGVYLSDSLFHKGASEVVLPYFRIYWISKLIELLDTVFMILRHRRRQISLLHVYHHSSILLLADVSYHVYPWPCIAVYLALNSFVHVVLYLYYGLTALNPDKSYPWKKNLTQLQILQFFVGFIHATIGYLYYGFCLYGLFYGLSMTYLFGNFYYYAYVKTKKIKTHES